MCTANDVSEIVDEGEGRRPQRALSRTATLKKTRRKTLKRSSKRKSKRAEGEEEVRKKWTESSERRKKLKGVLHTFSNV